MNPSATASSTAPSRRHVPFLEAVAFVAVLYLGKELFLPLALSVLISFLLAPIVAWFERRHLGRVPSVLATSVIAFTIIGGIGYIMAGQLVDLAKSLPNYRSNLQAKIISLKLPGDSPWNRVTSTLRDLTGEITGESSSAPPAASGLEGPDAVKQPAPAEARSARPRKTEKPIPVEVVQTSGSALATLSAFISPVVGPLSMAAIVVVLVIFVLLDREDMRDRFIYLMGRGRLHVTTQALDEAGHRVSQYILAQATVNGAYGIPIGLGLYFIGIPNAVLWGLLAAVLRFLPYIGAWTAAAFPMVLSLAIAPGWATPLWTLALFLGVELVTNNAVEPWLYGSRTGLSTLAIILSAIFWTWLWGPMGLILATPLTVCISVMGRYLPDLAFFELILGDKPPISASDRFYQRLVTMDAEGVSVVCEEYAAEHSLAATFDHVMIPALRLICGERRSGVVNETSIKEMLQLMREVVEDLAVEKLQNPAVPPAKGGAAILCLPASNESDELAALMLKEVLKQGGADCELVSSKALAAEMVETAAALSPKLLCVSCVPPVSIMAGRHLCQRLRDKLEGGTRIMVGIWGETPPEAARRAERFKRARADEVFESLGAAAREILLQAGFTAAPPDPAEAAGSAAESALAK